MRHADHLHPRDEADLRADNINFVPIGSISVYTLLDQGKATGGDGFSTDPQQLNTKKYTALVDDKHIFGFQNVAPVLKKSLLSGSNGALLASTANAVSAKLTLEAMQAMNKAYVRGQDDAEGDRERVPLGERAHK